MINQLIVAAALAASGVASAQDFVTSCSRDEAVGARTLCHEAVIDAPAADVWTLFATAEGMRTWMAPVAALDLRVGGDLETAYDPSARLGDAGNIHNRVVAYTPESLLVIQIAQAPPDFPHGEEARELTTVIALEPIDRARTRVRVSMLGYREGAAFDALYAFFDRGNAWTLQKLRERVLDGPVDWSEAR